MPNESKHRLWVIFSEKDLNKIIHKLSSKDVIICNINSFKYPEINIFNVMTCTIEEESIGLKVKDSLTELSLKYGDEIIGFSNNFYQCSVFLLVKFIKSIEQMSKRYPNSKIYFVNKVLFSAKKPNYFLAEYESQGVRLYDREGAFFGTIIKYCSDKGLPVSFLSKKISFQIISNYIRVFTVYFIKFYYDIVNSLSVVNVEKYTNKEIDFIFISRSISQSQFLKKIIVNNNYSNKVILFNNAQDKQHIGRAKEIFYEIKNASVISASAIKEYLIVGEYARSLKNIFTLKKQTIIIEKDIHIDITQAVREILVMLPHIVLYQKQLNQTISKISGKCKGLVFSTEQKSPHAYIDAIVANNNKLPCVQLMQCDQDNSDIPIPVTGDLFIPISRSKKEMLIKSWSSDNHKVFFPCQVSVNTVDNKNSLEFQYKVCFFSSFDDVEFNVNVAKGLRSIAQSGNFKILIKLHPRDGSNWWKEFNAEGCMVVQHHEIELPELIEIFEIAIGSFSAVMISLLEFNKQYILLDFGNFNVNLNDISYVDSQYQPVASNMNKMEFWINNKEKLFEQYDLLIKRCAPKAEELCSSKSYFEKILKRLKVKEKD